MGRAPMGKGKNRKPLPPSRGQSSARATTPTIGATIQSKIVQTLIDRMVDGREFESIVGLALQEGVDKIQEVRKGLNDLQAARGRPCLAYIGNVVSAGGAHSGIDSTDDLPFAEMVAAVPAEHVAVDVFLSTRGGSGHQVNGFVRALRSRFSDVNFLIPSFCMSAGTLFALSGNRIWMTPRASLGPIDPQVTTRDGRYVPAQALLLLVAQLQRDGTEMMKNGQPIPWTAVRIIDTLDKKDLADALTASQYSRDMAEEFIRTYKFHDWNTRESTGAPVTVEDKRKRAAEIAVELCSHEKWKAHGHAISRDVLKDELRLKIDFPDAALERLMRRAWAICAWVFDKTLVQKML